MSTLAWWGAKLLAMATRSPRLLPMGSSFKAMLASASVILPFHVRGNARIEGNLTLTGTQTIVDTNVSTTERIDITNDGTGPALVVNQLGAQPIAYFKDDNAIIMTIADGGNVALGTSNAPVCRLDVTGNVRLTSLGVGTTATGTTGDIRATGDITAFYSDRRLKTDIQDISDALSKINALHGVYYTASPLAHTYGYADNERQVGLIAQEVAEVLPEAVRLAPFDAAPDNTSLSGENYLTIQYPKLIPLLVNGIKALSARCDALEAQLKST
jgi:hypothetical protein